MNHPGILKCVGASESKSWFGVPALAGAMSEWPNTLSFSNAGEEADALPAKAGTPNVA